MAAVEGMPVLQVARRAREKVVRSVLSKAVRIGIPVQIGDNAHYGSGAVGTVTQVYGDPAYRAAEVTFEDGRTVLYWHFQIEPVDEQIGTPRDLPQALTMQR